MHFTETCEAGTPHLIVEVTATSATLADGVIVGELHALLDKQQMLQDQHVMDIGYIDAGVLAESQTRYHVNSVGLVMPDTSWVSKETGRFDHSQFLIDWQAKRVMCPARQTSRDWCHIPNRHGKPSLRVRFPLRRCRSCPLHAHCTPITANMLIVRPDEAGYNALVAAHKREATREFRTLPTKRAGVEGTMAQAVRTCEMRQARSIGSQKLRLQHFYDYHYEYPSCC